MLSQGEREVVGGESRICITLQPVKMLKSDSQQTGRGEEEVYSYLLLNKASLPIIADAALASSSCITTPLTAT